MVVENDSEETIVARFLQKQQLQVGEDLEETNDNLENGTATMLKEMRGALLVLKKSLER